MTYQSFTLGQLLTPCNFIMSCKDTYFGSLVVSFAIKKGGKFMECALKMDKPPNKALVIENIFTVSIKYYSILYILYFSISRHAYIDQYNYYDGRVLLYTL